MTHEELLAELAAAEAEIVAAVEATAREEDQAHNAWLDYLEETAHE